MWHETQPRASGGNSSYAAYEEGNPEQTNVKVTPLW